MRNRNPNKPSITMIDPPSGWRYGFPKILPRDVKDEDLGDWLINHGYPRRDIDLALKYSRYWEKQLNEHRGD